MCVAAALISFGGRVAARQQAGATKPPSGTLGRAVTAHIAVASTHREGQQSGAAA